MQYCGFGFSLAGFHIMGFGVVTACSLVVGWDLLFRGNTLPPSSRWMGNRFRNRFVIYVVGGSTGQGETWIHKLKNKVTVHAVKWYRRRGSLVPLILNPGERAPGIYSLGCSVDLRAGVDAVEKKQITCPCWDSNCDSSVFHPLA